MKRNGQTPIGETLVQMRNAIARDAGAYLSTAHAAVLHGEYEAAAVLAESAAKLSHAARQMTLLIDGATLAR